MIVKLAAALLLVLITAAPATAQEELVPAEIGGAPAEVSLLTGPQLLAGLDAADPWDARTIGQIETLLAVTGQPVERLTAASAFPAADASGGYVVALRVAGAEAAVLSALLVAGMREDLAEPHQESVEVAGRSTIRITDAASRDDSTFTLYASGDTAWLIGGSDAEVAAILERLP